MSFRKFQTVFNLFQNREIYFDKISKNENTGKLIISQLIIICVFAFLYGLVMGSYHGSVQSLIAGVKVVVLFLSTLLICFPSFFIIQLILGSKMRIKQVIVMVLSGFVLSTIIALSFAPVVIFFLITGNNYYFLQLLHVSIFIFAGFFGMKLIIDALKHACDKENIYPQVGVTVFRLWVVILAFVGIQLAWNLRPFLGDKDKEFKLFRRYKGNFYTAVIYSMKQLTSNDDNKEQKVEDISNEEIRKPVESDTVEYLKFIN